MFKAIHSIELGEIMTEIKVSVIIPAHNATPYITEAIASAQNQTLTEIEILVVDDASTDETAALVSKIAKVDERVKLISLSSNQGVAVARNTGVSHACGEYVAFLDADDQWLPSKLRLQLDFLVKHQAKFGYGNYALIDAHGAPKGERRVKAPSLNHAQMLGGNRIGLLTVILTRELALAHPFPRIHGEDYACWLSIARSGVTAYRCSKENIARYRIHASSTSANKLRAASWTWAIYRDFEHMNFVRAVISFVRYAFMAVFDRR